MVYELLRQAPDLVCVLCDLGDWGSERFYRPLLDRYRGVHVETSVLALHESAIETVVRDHAAERLLFGTGFPDRSPGAAMLPVVHADISDEAKVAIASGNARRLLAEAKR
jgi:predicted TIM-barrel fold metal-dependent hydrolase